MAIGYLSVVYVGIVSRHIILFMFMAALGKQIKNKVQTNIEHAKAQRRKEFSEPLRLSAFACY
jgi:hypothetical protein